MFSAGRPIADGCQNRTHDIGVCGTSAIEQSSARVDVPDHHLCGARHKVVWNSSLFRQCHGQFRPACGVCVANDYHVYSVIDDGNSRGARDLHNPRVPIGQCDLCCGAQYRQKLYYFKGCSDRYVCGPFPGRPLERHRSVSARLRHRVLRSRSPRPRSQSAVLRVVQFTQQLRDYADFAERTHRRFDLYVREGADLTHRQLTEAISSGRINIIAIP